MSLGFVRLSKRSHDGLPGTPSVQMTRVQHGRIEGLHFGHCVKSALNNLLLHEVHWLAANWVLEGEISRKEDP